jgi:hypothetical protein
LTGSTPSVVVIGLETVEAASGGWNSVDLACRESSWDSCMLATSATAELALSSGTPVIGMALNHVPSDLPNPLPLLSARTNGAFFPIVDPSQIALALRSLPAVAGHTVGFHRLRFEIPASADYLRAFRPGNTMAARLTLQTAGGARTQVGVTLQIRE